MDGYGLIYGDSPIDSLKSFLVILSILSLGLHFLRPNFFTWIMVPILLFMSFRFYSLLRPLSSELSQYAESGSIGMEADIALDNFSAYEGLASYPLIIAVFYVITIVFAFILKKKKVE
jgi:hypothetical protein